MSFATDSQVVQHWPRELPLDLEGFVGTFLLNDKQLQECVNDDTYLI